MCRNIRPLFNFEPPARRAEIEEAAVQFVRKVSGFRTPSRANQEAFERAVSEVAHAVEHLLSDLVTNAPPRDRAAEAERARRRNAKRFG